MRLALEGILEKLENLDFNGSHLAEQKEIERITNIYRHRLMAACDCLL